MYKRQIKTSSLTEPDAEIVAPVSVFNDQETVLEAFGTGRLNKDCIIVVRGQGPSANGMPELHKLTSPLNVLQSKGYKVAIITDGRMSGASGSVPAVIHITPEAKLGGTLAIIQDGDIIKIDIINGVFNLLVEDDLLVKRTPMVFDDQPSGIGRELFKSFRTSVSSVETGASIF